MVRLSIKNTLNLENFFLLSTFLLLSVWSVFERNINTFTLLIIIIGSILYFKQRQILKLPKELIWLNWLFIAYVVSALYSLLNNSNFGYAGARFEKYYPYLLIIPSVYIFWSLRRRIIALFYPAMIISGLISSATILILTYNSYSQGTNGHLLINTLNGLNTNIFSHLTFSIAIISLSISIFAKKENAKLRLIGFITSAITAFSATLLLSRGATLAFIIVAILLIAIKTYNNIKNRKTKKCPICIISLVIIISAPIMLNIDNWKTRFFTHIESDLSRYNNGDSMRNSIGTRLNMWHGSVLIWQKNPLLGTGIGDSEDDLNKLIADGKIQKSNATRIMHNDFMDVLSTTGFIGLLIALAAFYLFPLWLFVSFSKKDEHNYFAFTGIAFIVNNLFFSLTNSWMFLRSQPLIMILFIILLIGVLHLSKTSDD